MLSARPHGETDAILSALTFEHGRHVGLVKGGDRAAGAAAAAAGQSAGADLEGAAGRASRATSRAEPMQAVRRPAARRSAAARRPRPRPRRWSTRRWPSASRIRASMPACSSCSRRMLADPRWPETYVRFELLLLQELGFALDLERCAVTGGDGRPRLRLAADRPRGRPGGRRRSRRAAAAAAAVPRRPTFLLTFADVAAGLRLSGHFLARQAVRPRPTSPCPPPASG